MNAEYRPFVPENTASHLTERSAPAYAGKRGNFMATEAGVMTGQRPETITKNQEKPGPKKEGKKEASVVANRRKAAIEWGKFLAKVKAKIRPEVVRENIQNGITPDKYTQKPQDLRAKNDKYDEQSLRNNWNNFLKNDTRVDAKAVDRLISDGIPPEDTLVLDGAYLSEGDWKTIRAFWEGIYGEKSEIPPAERQMITTHIAHGTSPERAVQESIEETLRQQWKYELGSAWNSPDTRSTVETAVALGYSPETVTAKEGTGLPEVRAVEVIRNALIPDNERRLTEAEKHLKQANLLDENETFTPAQKEAIVKAHEYGIEEDPETGKKVMTLDGKDGGKAGVFNYDADALKEKTVFMQGDNPQDPVLVEQQRRALMEAGYVGFAKSSDLPDFDPVSFTDPIISNYAGELDKRLNSGREADGIFLQNLAGTLRGLKNRGGGDVNIAEADRLLDDVELLRQVALYQSEQEAKAEQDRVEDTRRSSQREGGRDGSRQEREYEGLARDVASYNELLRENPNARDIVKEQAFITQIKDAINKPGMPPVDTREFPDDLIQAAGGFRETREMLISQIIFKAYEDNTERNEYRGTIDLYGQDSLKKLLSSARLDPTDTEHEQYQTQLALETSAELFHTMNAKILAGTLEEFSRTSERIDPKHFKLMNSLKGVGQVMRLYEQKYSEALAKNGVIYDYNAVKNEVEASFRAMATAGFVITEYDTRADQRLENWEIERALNVGRNFSNITFRAGEYMALGEPAKLAPNIRYGSAPQESTVKLLNHLQWVADRFDVGGGRGGNEFYEMVQEKFHASNKEDQLGWNRKKLGYNQIKKFGGRTVDQMELAEFFGTKSFYSSWRLTNMSEKVKFSLNSQNPEETMTLKEWSAVNGEKIGELRKQVEPDAHGHVHHDHMHHVQEGLVDLYKPLVEKLDNGLGILLVSHDVGGEPGYLVRKMIWEKVAHTNAPMMMNYLDGVVMDHPIEKDLEKKIKEGKMTEDQAWEERNRNYPSDFARSIQIIKKEVPGDWDKIIEEVVRDAQGNPIKKQDGAEEIRKISKFDIFKEKILQHHQRNVLQASGVDVVDMELEPLTPEELILQAKITAEGVKLAPHLADVLFAYTPFMNDVAFEEFDYEAPGQEAYKRLINDFGDYQRAQHGYDAIQDHVAGGAKIDDVVGALKKMEGGMSGPPGSKEGMIRSAPVVEAVLDFYEAGGDSFMAKQLLYRLVKETFEKPNSKSQEYGSVLTEALDESGMRVFLEKLNKAGVISHAKMTQIRKRKRLNMGWLYAALFRDLLAFFVAGMVAEAIDEGMEDIPVAGNRGRGRGGGGDH